MKRFTTLTGWAALGLGTVLVGGSLIAVVAYNAGRSDQAAEQLTEYQYEHGAHGCEAVESSK